MTSQQAADLIGLLEAVAARPGLFFGKPDVSLALVFLEGFHAALAAALGLDSALPQQVAVDRGWRTPGATGPGIEGQMLEAGMSPEQILAELVAIEIEVIRRSTR